MGYGSVCIVENGNVRRETKTVIFSPTESFCLTKWCSCLFNKLEIDGHENRAEHMTYTEISQHSLSMWHRQLLLCIHRKSSSVHIPQFVRARDYVFLPDAPGSRV